MVDDVFQMVERLARENGLDAIANLFNESSIERAVVAYAKLAGLPASGKFDDVPPGGHAWVAAWVLSHRDALRRASIALSDPRARGVERAVLGHLADGLDIEDALRKASAPLGRGRDADAVVIPFPRRPD